MRLWHLCLCGLAVVMSVAIASGCRRELSSANEAFVPANLTHADGPLGRQQYQFSAETGFSASLGDRPRFTPRVKSYTVSPNLANIVNLGQFKDILRQRHLRQLAKTGIVVVPADWKQMEFVYEMNNYPEQHIPSFVTTDSVLHTWHIFFDYCLRTIEVTTLYDRLCTLATGLLQVTAAQYERGGPDEVKQAARSNFAFALVPVRLLEIPREQCGVMVPAEVEALASQELALIAGHEGFKPSPTARFSMDYSQFIPRGHYTRSEKLQRYFKAMMWYGLIPLAFRDISSNPAPDQARQAVLMAEAVLYGRVGSEPIGKVWEDVYEPTAFLVGFADDNTPGDFGKIIPGLFGEPLATEKLVPEEGLLKLAEHLLELRPPGIRMAQVTGIPELGGIPDLPGIPQFRVMGQRFVPDSYLFQMMVFPHVGKGIDAPNDPLRYNMRTFPIGLDIASILGSDRAYEIATKVYKQDQFLDYEQQTQKLRAEVAAYTDEDWSRNVYNGWLQTLKLLIEPKGEGYPAFVRTQAWLDKQLNTALGSWAELRHDTILYAKQSVVAECGGGEEELPKTPRGYVEPEVLVYWRLGLLAAQLRDGLTQRKLLTDESLLGAFHDFISLLKFLQGVSIKELQAEPLTEDEFEQIHYYGDTLARLNLLSKYGAEGDEITSMADKDMAVIADVHTGPIGTEHFALQVGVGHANEIYVIYPVSGKLYLGRGAVFGYYEFVVPIAGRLTDEAWQERLGSSTPPQPPKWTRSFLSLERTSGERVEFEDIPVQTRGGC